MKSNFQPRFWSLLICPLFSSKKKNSPPGLLLHEFFFLKRALCSWWVGQVWKVTLYSKYKKNYALLSTTMINNAFRYVSKTWWQVMDMQQMPTNVPAQTALRSHKPISAQGLVFLITLWAFQCFDDDCHHLVSSPLCTLNSPRSFAAWEMKMWKRKTFKTEIKVASGKSSSIP